MVSGAGDRLTDVVAAVLEVAAEAGEAGTYTVESAQAMAAVLKKVAVRVVIDAEVRGFSSGWREAMELVAGDGTGAPRAARLPGPDGDLRPRSGPGDR
ncbi:hypothetical protein [Streptomyces cyaneofuscatus]|uniref:hypothetical protein n=1 Tax=Streptomyces cyaneofuscatus TaxID=66883 RepID=UPI0036632E32